MFSPEENKQYKEEYRTEELVKREVVQNYRGVKGSSLVKERKEWSLSVGRVLPKDKDISRSRPIVPFTKHIGRRLGKIVGAAMTAVIKEVGKYWITMNLGTTQEFTYKIWQANDNRFWKRKRGGEFTMVKMDIKNQFTNMDKEEGYRSVCMALEELERKGKYKVRVCKDRGLKHRDGFKAGGRDYWMVSTEDIREYVRFELDNCYIKVLDKIYKQVGGLPMGGMVSACVAQLDAMRKEKDSPEAWRRAKFPGLWGRYRDDTFLLTPNKRGNKWAERVAKGLGEMYGAGLTVEVEDIQHKEINMLDTKVVVTDEGLVTRDNNKNINWEKEGWMDVRKWKVRYPAVGSNMDNRIFINTIIGAQTATKRRANSVRCYEEDTLKNVVEWHTRGYRHNWIMRAFYRVDIGIVELVRPFLAMLRHGREEGGGSSG